MLIQQEFINNVRFNSAAHDLLDMKSNSKLLKALQ